MGRGRASELEVVSLISEAMRLISRFFFSLSLFFSQCAKRGLLCCYPGESRRGMRHGRASRRVSYRDGSNIVFTPGDEDEYTTDEDDDEDDDTPSPGGFSSSYSNAKKNKEKNKKRKPKKPKPMEWIIAVDAHFITPAAWQAYLADQAQKRAEREAAREQAEMYAAWERGEGPWPGGPPPGSGPSGSGGGFGGPPPPSAGAGASSSSSSSYYPGQPGPSNYQHRH